LADFAHLKSQWRDTVIKSNARQHGKEEPQEEHSAHGSQITRASPKVGTLENWLGSRAQDHEGGSSDTGSREPISSHNRFEILASSNEEATADTKESHQEHGRGTKQEEPAHLKLAKHATKLPRQSTGGKQGARKQDEVPTRGPRHCGNPSTSPPEEAAETRAVYKAGSRKDRASGPGSAGRPFFPIRPAVTKGGDLEEVGGVPLGRLAQDQGREEGSPEPGTARTATGTGPAPHDTTLAGGDMQGRQVGQLCPTKKRAFPGAGNPGRAKGRGVAEPD
jgi:hypothetical protein